jgi:septum formation protein
MIDTQNPLLLGSGSPRRRELLELLGLPLRVVPVAIDESVRAGEHPDAYLERITIAKLAAVTASPQVVGCGAVLVADTIVLHAGAVLGKPRDESEAARMLRMLSGEVHDVWTRFALAGPDDPARPAHAETVRTHVYFRRLEEHEIVGYAASGEGLDKAGAYAIQGLGGFMVWRIEGSYHNVVGLPVCEVIVALRALGLLGAFPFRAGAVDRGAPGASGPSAR